MRRPHWIIVSGVAAAALLVACSGKSGGLLGGPYVARRSCNSTMKR
jgi:hypothetical protein